MSIVDEFAEAATRADAQDCWEGHRWEVRPAPGRIGALIVHCCKRCGVVCDCWNCRVGQRLWARLRRTMEQVKVQP